MFEVKLPVCFKKIIFYLAENIPDNYVGNLSLYCTLF